VSRSLASIAGARRLRVELRPTSVKLLPESAFGSRLFAARAIAVEVAAGGREVAPEPWRGAVEALADALREPRGRLARVEVVLSDHFVRYLLVPWSSDLVGDDERLGFARLSFRELYGQVSDAWDLALDEQPAGEASFACAIDRALAVSLREIVTRVGARLAALTPALADCINRHRKALKAQEFCFAVAEPRRISLAFRSRAGWEAVRSRRIDGPLSETLPTLLKQETVVGAAREAGVLYLCADALADAAPFPVPGWRVVQLGAGGFARRAVSDRQLVAAGG
jgi:hypothetical protein